jgi:hypothetical protein
LRPQRMAQKWRRKHSRNRFRNRFSRSFRPRFQPRGRRFFRRRPRGRFLNHNRYAKKISKPKAFRRFTARPQSRRH